MAKKIGITLSLSFVLIALLVTICQSYMSSDIFELSWLQPAQEHCCGMEKTSIFFGQDHISIFKTVNSFNLVETVLLFWAFILISVLLDFFKDEKVQFLRLNSQIISNHMKPWDPLRFALAQGIVQDKHLD